ncbi:unnamed protein product [Adineta steineri]|uniref:Chitinase n=1 Tax=Adineta steineri TaxID=433720 RepID=A0A816AAY2_9BILA|nr:unnamed protein product [Adineta steineri]CAF1157265.1 unnamed protein product [Adineta steineri]CAF1592911.1 unnamed protein product [Adineta steineri]CAF1594423.1 unnamed protein product [Adineta steineri]
MLRVCYITNWSRYRSGEAKFEIEFIDPFMCSHIIYAYAIIDDHKPEIVPVQKDDLEHYRELALLKKSNPNLKILIRLGGKISLYTRFLRHPNMAAQIVRSLIWFMATHSFDGVDIALEFADADVPEDKAALTTLLEELGKQRRLMHRTIITLTAAPFVENLLKVYDIRKIESLVNYINLMTFDFYGPWDEKTGIFAPLFHQPYQLETESLRNVDGLVKLWLSLGIPREKLIIGIPAYGRSFSLSTEQKGLHAPTNGPGHPGRYTKTKGFLSYYEVCEKGQSQNWQRVWLDSEKGWYMTSDDQWISYEDVDSAALKAQYAKAEQLGGIFIWSIDNDEFSGFFCNTEPFPITRQVFSTLNLPLPETSSRTIAIHQRIPSIIGSPTNTPTVRFVNVQAQTTPPPAIIPNNLQQLLNALSILSGTTRYTPILESSSSSAAPPPPPVAHQTYNAEQICSRHQAGRNGIYGDRRNCSIFYFCEGDDLNALRYHIFFCPPGLEFSMEACTCDWPTGRSCHTTSDTFCVSHASPATTTTTTTPIPPTYPTNIPQSAMIALNGLGQLLGTSGSSSPIFDCNGRRSGLYRDMYDCTKFYFCTTNNQPSDGTLLRYDFICPTNYAFSMTTCRCELGQSHTCHTLTKTDCLLL